MAFIVHYQRGVYTRTFAHRLSNSRAKRGRPILSPFVPETFICFHSGKQRWTARDGSGDAKTHARVVWEFHNGPVPDGYHVHHKNGDPTDYHNDCIENLMLLTQEWNLDYMPKLARGFVVPESVVTRAYLRTAHLPYAERFAAVCLILLAGLLGASAIMPSSFMFRVLPTDTFELIDFGDPEDVARDWKQARNTVKGLATQV